MCYDGRAPPAIPAADDLAISNRQTTLKEEQEMVLLAHPVLRTERDKEYSIDKIEVQERDGVYWVAARKDFGNAFPDMRGYEYIKRFETRAAAEEYIASHTTRELF